QSVSCACAGGGWRRWDVAVLALGGLSSRCKRACAGRMSPGWAGAILWNGTGGGGDHGRLMRDCGWGLGMPMAAAPRPLAVIRGLVMIGGGWVDCKTGAVAAAVAGMGICGFTRCRRTAR